MSWFAAQTGARPLEAPQNILLWPSHDGLALTWNAPPPGLSAILVLGGDAEPLAEIARLVPASRRWLVPAGVGPLLTVAWQRGGERGPCGALVGISRQSSVVSRQELESGNSSPRSPAGCPLGGGSAVPDPQPGARWAAGAQSPIPSRVPAGRRERSPQRPAGAQPCPLCQAELRLEGGIWICAGRCGARWIETGMGRLLDVAGLPLGICGCCMPPQMLAQGAGEQAVCPRSGAAYLLLADGTRQALSDLPFGLCQCCAPPQPLMRQGDAMVCKARPQQTYQHTAAGWQPLRVTPASASQALAEIDAALRRNTAKLNINGLFDFD